MKFLQKIGRYIFALAFIGLGVLNIVRGGGAAGSVPHFMPVPTLWVFVTGVAYILAAISIIINVYSRIACILLGLLIFLIAFSVHGWRLVHGINIAANAPGFLEALAIGAAAWMAGWRGKSDKQKGAAKTNSGDDIASEDWESGV